MTRRILFSPKALEALHTQGMYLDGKTPHLFVRVSKTVKTFVYYRRFGKSNIKLRIGRFPEVSIDEARTKALEFSTYVAKGYDPRQAPGVITRTSPTIDDIWQAYWETHGQFCKTANKLDRMWRHYFVSLRYRKAAQITRLEVELWHCQLGKKHGQVAANHAAELLSAMYNKAIRWSMVDCSNPVSGLEKFAVTERERYLSNEECERYLSAVEGLKSETTRDFFKMLLFTSQRKTNVLRMRWDQLDLSAQQWVIPESEMKNGKKQVLPLIGLATAILRRRRTDGIGSPWVFPGEDPGEPMKNVQTAWKYVLKRSGLINLRIHDIRHTGGSWLAMTGAEMPIIMRSLGHKSSKSTLRYLHMNNKPVRRAMEKSSAAMLR